VTLSRVAHCHSLFADASTELVNNGTATPANRTGDGTTNDLKSVENRLSKLEVACESHDRQRKGMLTHHTVATGAPFVLSSSTSANDDPFTSTASASNGTVGVTGRTNGDETSPASQSTDSNVLPIFTPREDRLGQEISGENAQGVHPPEACAFVAK
jgi:hypothetical protein